MERIYNIVHTRQQQKKKSIKPSSLSDSRTIKLDEENDNENGFQANCARCYNNWKFHFEDSSKYLIASDI